MIVKALALREDGTAVLPGYASALQLGYAGNCGLYAVKATLQGAWQGLTVRVVWHIPGGIAAPTTLLQDQQCAVPAEVTAAAGRGVATFEGTDGHGVTWSAQMCPTLWAQTAAPQTVSHPNPVRPHGTSSSGRHTTLPPMRKSIPCWMKFLTKRKQERTKPWLATN